MREEINIKNFEVEMRMRIDWSELDYFGHVNNVMFMKYIQTSRVHYCEKIELMENYQSRGIGFMLASTSCQFLKPLFYPGNVILRAKYEFMKNTSFGIIHYILNENEELAAIGKDILVTFDYQINEKVKIPEWLRNNIQNLQRF